MTEEAAEQHRDFSNHSQIGSGPSRIIGAVRPP
jgi:hypothetical protein